MKCNNSAILSKSSRECHVKGIFKNSRRCGLNLWWKIFQRVTRAHRCICKLSQALIYLNIKSIHSSRIIGICLRTRKVFLVSVEQWSRFKYWLQPYDASSPPATENKNGKHVQQSEKVSFSSYFSLTYFWHNVHVCINIEKRKRKAWHVYKLSYDR